MCEVCIIWSQIMNTDHSWYYGIFNKAPPKRDNNTDVTTSIKGQYFRPKCSFAYSATSKERPTSEGARPHGWWLFRG